MRRETRTRNRHVVHMDVTAPCSRPVLATALDGPRAGHILTRAERARHDRLPSADRRRDFRAGRLAARRAVRRLGEEGRAGAPSLSIAHRDGRGVAAAGPFGTRIGVDIERVGAVGPHEVRYFLSARERDAGLAGHRAPRDGDPTLLWALKEAAWKLLGPGAATPFRAVELVFDEGARVAGLRHGGRVLPVGATVWHPWAGYLAVCVWRAT